MNQASSPSSRSKWLILTGILVGIIIGFVLAMSVTLYFPGVGTLFPRKSERMIFGSSEFSQDQSSGNITGLNLQVANIGADDLIVDKVFINGTLLESSEWQCLPAMRLKPGDQGVLYMTLTWPILLMGPTYEFTIETAAGNVFSHIATPKPTSFIFIATEQVTFTNFSWGANNAYAVITVKNTGTSDLSISAVKIDGAAPATITPSLASPYLLAKGTSMTFNMTRTGGFTSGVSYEFTVTTSKGNSFGPYTRTAV